MRPEYRYQLAGTPEQLGRIWNCWTRNYISSDYGYIIHAMELTETGQATGRTMCGFKWTGETGMVNLRDDPDWRPGCYRCMKILVRRGILVPPSNG